MNGRRVGLMALLLGMVLLPQLGSGCGGESRFPVISSGEMVDIQDHLEADEWTLVVFTADW